MGSSKIVVMESVCVLCGVDGKTTLHLCRDCVRTKAVPQVSPALVVYVIQSYMGYYSCLILLHGQINVHMMI